MLMPHDTLTDEPGRLAALSRYDILDTAAEGAFDRITDLVRTALGVPMSAVSLIDSHRQWLKSHPGIDVSETPREIAFCDHAIRGRDALIVADASLDIRFRENPLVTSEPAIASYAGVPLETPDGYNIGTLCAIDTRPRAFDPTQIAILKSLAALVVEQLELRNMAERDGLTGALTRRAFINDLDKKITLYQRSQRPAALLMLDIDHFKAVNDSHGHPAGDKVLRAVARLCDAGRRPADTLGRLGGEEFGLLLSETSEAAAFQAANRFCRAMRDLVVDNDPPLRVTVSFGVAALCPVRTTSDLWLAAADAALYEAKRAGRNRVAVSPVPGTRAA
jgi:diguanylate cyclase (GGDEF)-like protein